jgi:cyclin H
VTDVYFHYTPSQIMLAALSLADRDLADRVINETFHHHQPPHPTDHNTTSKSKPLSTTTTRLPLLSAETRDRVTQTIHSCRDVLAREPPERLAAYWSTPESTQITKPLLRKLKKCRDPDRWDLVAYQAARREQALSRRRQKDGPDNGDGDGDGGEDGDGEGRGLGDGAAVFGDALLGGGGGGGGHDVKRRKVAAKLDDPFGGPL